MSFGQYPDVTLHDARERHGAARKLLAGGVDPMAKRKSEKVAGMAADSGSFRTVALLWIDHWKVIRASNM